MKKITTYCVALFVLQFAVAVICAPYSCEWGNGIYFFTGIACFCIAFAVCLLQKQWLLQKRLLMGLLMILLAVLLWCAGFLLLDFRILCRLF